MSPFINSEFESNRVGVMVENRIAINRDILEGLYARYNHREYVDPDPLEVVLRYDDPRDREIVALIASSLAYGRVAQIVVSVSRIVDEMGSPYDFLMNTTRRSLSMKYRRFKHRFTTGREVSGMLWNTRTAIEEYGSLEACFLTGLSDDDSNVVKALSQFVKRLRGGNGTYCPSLLPDVPKGSACKRLNLFLKWLVRKDAVDPGGWDMVDKSKLVIPLDTHMYRIGYALGMTKRRSADWKTALEITNGFRAIAPEDPTKYDFALTRIGMKHGVGVLDLISNS